MSQATLGGIRRRSWKVLLATLGLLLLFMPFSALVLDASYDHTLRTVALGGALLGIVSGVLGSFTVLRHQSLMGDALSHAALPGVALAFLLAGRQLEWLLLGAGLASWLGIVAILSITRSTRIKQDAAMGIVLTSWFALGITLLTYIQGRDDGQQAGLDKFIFGQAAAIVQRDVMMIALVGALALGCMVLFWKEFKLLSFDYEFAAANGFRVRLLDLLLSALVVVATVLGLQLAGVILMVGMLIAPGIAARQWTQDLGDMVLLAGAFGAFAGVTGAVISAIDTNLPTGPLIIVVAFLIVLLSMVFAPGRGLLWQQWRAYQDRRRFAVQNVLRDLYRYGMSHGNAYHGAEEAFLRGLRGKGAQQALKQLQKKGLVQLQGERWTLTASGVQQAQQDAHNQTLWELYRSYGEEMQLPSVPENRQQDIHRLLPAEAVARLENLSKGATG